MQFNNPQQLKPNVPIKMENKYYRVYLTPLKVYNCTVPESLIGIETKNYLEIGHNRFEFYPKYTIWLNKRYIDNWTYSHLSLMENLQYSKLIKNNSILNKNNYSQRLNIDTKYLKSISYLFPKK